MSETNKSSRKGSDNASESQSKKSETQRPDTKQSGESESSDKTKKTTKNDETSKVDQTSNQSESESEDKTTRTKKSQAAKKTENETDNRQRVIRFEDEAYKMDRFEKSLDAPLFVDYLLDYYDGDMDTLFLIPEQKTDGKCLQYDHLL